MSKKFVVTGPDGKKYNVTAPDDATQEDAIAYIKNRNTGGAGDYVERQVGMIPREIGLTARAAAQGLAYVPNAIMDAPKLVRRALGSKSAQEEPTYSERFSSLLTKAGLPEPQTHTEKIIQDLSEGLVGTGATELAMGTKEIPAIARAISTSLTSSGASGAARELKLPAWAQLAAGTIAGLRPGGLGLKAPKADSIRAPGNEVRMMTWKDAKENNYRFPPSAIERSFTREKIESTVGKQQLYYEFSRRNQQNTNELIRADAGLRPKEPITEAALEQARDAMAEPYRKVAALSPTAASALEELKNVRQQAKIYHRHADISGDPKSLAEAQRLDAEGHIYEAMIDAEAVKTGIPGLLSDLRTARTKIAKNWDADRALNTATGDIRAEYYGNKVNKQGVDALSGPALTVGKTQQAFPQYMKETAKAPSPGVHKLEAAGSLFGGMVGYHYGGLKGAAAGALLPQVGEAGRLLAMHGMQHPLGQQGIPVSAMVNFLAKQADPTAVAATQDRLRKAAGMGYPAMLRMLESEQ